MPTDPERLFSLRGDLQEVQRDLSELQGRHAALRADFVDGRADTLAAILELRERTLAGFARIESRLDHPPVRRNRWALPLVSAISVAALTLSLYGM